LEHWDLEFGICLEIRIWSLEFDGEAVLFLIFDFNSGFLTFYFHF